MNLVDPMGMMEEIVTTAPRIHPPSLFGLHTLFSLSFLNSSSRGTDEPKSEGSDATDGSDKCLSPGPVNDQAKEALKKHNPLSIKENLELGGNIWKSWVGTYGYDVSRGDHRRIKYSNLPIGKRRVGLWHTHGATDPRFESESFSPKDISDANALGVPSFLGTPNRNLLMYNPETRRVEAFDDLKEGCK